MGINTQFWFSGSLSLSPFRFFDVFDGHRRFRTYLLDVAMHKKIRLIQAKGLVRVEFRSDKATAWREATRVLYQLFRCCDAKN
jgi:hypothetical protein